MINHKQSPRYLIRHLGNMGDMVFIVPPVLAAIKKEHPNCHITFITSWGYKDNRGRWGSRNQSGHSLHLLMTNPNIDQLIHWHDTKLSLEKTICREDGKSFPTWNKAHYETQKKSPNFDMVLELDFGIGIKDNPIEHALSLAKVDPTNSSFHQIHLTENDKKIAKYIINDFPQPRIVLTNSLRGISTRNWDPDKADLLTKAIKDTYHVNPIWFGGEIPMYHGRPLTLRENIAILTFCDVCIGVLSGPLHFAAAVDLPTLTLFCDHPLHRAAPAFFLNKHIKDDKKKHRTLLGPTPSKMELLKPAQPCLNLTPTQIETQHFKHWSNPGRQSTKSCLSTITVDEVMQVLSDMI